MKKSEACRDMTEIRSAIDAIDHQIVALIARRAQYVRQAGKFKKDEQSVRDVERVKKVISSKVALAKKYGISPELIERIYTIMVDFFVSEELKGWHNKM